MRSGRNSSTWNFQQLQQPRAGLRVQRQVDRALDIAGQIFPGLPQRRLHGAAVGTLQGCGQGRRRQDAAVQVARQHRHVEGFAGAVEIAAGIDKKIIGARCVAAGVEFGQVERGFAQRQDRHFLVARRANDPCVGKAAIEADVALRIGGGLGQRLARAVHQFEHCARNRLARLQRHRIGLDAVTVATRMQPDVADIEIRDLVFVSETAGLAHDRDVDAGFLQFLDAFDRQERDVAAIGLVVGDEAALVDAGRERVEPVQIPIADRALQAAVTGVAPVVFVIVATVIVFRLGGAAADAQHGFKQFGHTLGGHAQELHVHLGHVHRRDGKAAILSGRQHHAAAGEIERRRHGLRADVAMRGFGQRDLIACAGQARAHRDRVGALRLHVRKVDDARIVADNPVALDDLALGRGIARPDRGRLLARGGGRFAVLVGLADGRSRVRDLQEGIQVGLGIHRLGEGHGQR